MRIPKCMSTQHPDNVSTPFFASGGELQGEDEVREAYYAFTQLDCDEQMWDCEGKEIDGYVVKKLLTQHPECFREQKLGQDLFITLRVPNPLLERAEAKILLETLESIPRSYDAAHLFYGEEIAPIFEVILPMTTGASCLDRIFRYYQDFVVGKRDKQVGDINVCDWIGDFRPANINVIPLFEDKPSMLAAADIVRDYLRDKDIGHQRVFLAHSDPALNYGKVSAVLLNKIALAKLDRLSVELGVEIYPILGAGSAPFRGNLVPHRVEPVAQEFNSVHTFTIQSAFKYDYHPRKVREGIEFLQARTKGEAPDIDETRALALIEKYSSEYKRQISQLAGMINRVAGYIPRRRKRKLHIGLFGYARNNGEIALPRAITFTAALYSVGLPPELLALNSLSEADMRFLRQTYLHFETDLGDALRYYNPDSPFVPTPVREAVNKWFAGHELDKEHKKNTDFIAQAVRDNKADTISDAVLEAARIRRFLG